MTGWLQEGSLLLMLFLLPVSKAVIEITSVLMILAWFVDRARPRTRADSLWWQPEMRPLLGWLIAFFGACALSIAVSAHPAQGLDALIGKWGQYLMLCVVAADVLRRPGAADRCVLALVGSSALVLFEGCWQERVGRGLLRPKNRLDYFGRMTGPYENPIDLATYLMVMIPTFLGALQRWRRPLARVAGWGLILALTACMARTAALGAWIGLGIALAVMVLLDLRRAATIAGLVATAAVGSLIAIQHAPRWLSQALSVSDIGAKDRIAMWSAAMGMIRDRPWLGHGLNTFMANYLDYWVGGERMPRYAHNCYLQMTAETGLIGGALFIGLLVAAFWRIFRSLRALQDPDRCLALGLAAGLLGFAAQAGIDTNFYALRQAAMFWTLTGITLGLCAGSRQPLAAVGQGRATSIRPPAPRRG